MKPIASSRTAGALLLGLAMCLPRPAMAFELFGTCLIGECKKDAAEFDTLIDPRIYEAEFNIDSEKETVVTALKAASQLWTNRDTAVAGSAGLVARAKGDYRRLLGALYNNGRYAGAISITINGEEAANIPAGQDTGQNAKVVIRVQPGPAYLFGRTSIINAAPPALDPDDFVLSLEDAKFATGERADAGRVQRAGKLAVEAWRQQGHALADIERRDAKAIHPSQTLDVTLRLKPGPKAFYDRVNVEGTERMDPEFVAYMTGLLPGKEYDPDDIKRAEKRLDRLGVFSTRKLNEGTAINTNGLLPINLLVSERKLRRIGLGATLSSVDGAGLEAYWLHRNLWGKAERLRFDAKLGGVGSTLEADELDYLLSATLTQPGIFTPDTDLAWNIYAKQEFNEAYGEKSAGASADLTNYKTDQLTLKAGGFLQFAEIEDAFGTRRFLTTGLNSEATYDTRDNKLDASRGFYTNVKATPFYEWERSNAAVRLEAEARGYFAFDDRKRSILAARVKLGSLLGAPLVETPASYLFAAGGGNSVRGFAFKSIGVEQANGEESGGRSLFETSVEFRQRFGQSFGAVAFVDAGQVTSNSFSNFSDDLKIGAGLGFRYYTGLGPIRLDFAVPLNPGDEDPDFAFYAGIGHAF